MAGVAAKKAPGYYADGGGLYLQVSATGAKSWIFRFMLQRRAREMGLGSVRDKSLAAARDAAFACRQLLLAGVDPIVQRNETRQQPAPIASKAVTFKECVIEYHRTHRSAWRNEKHAAQWLSTQVIYAFPLIGDKAVNDVIKGDILSILEPIWYTRHETATRVRQRIKVVLDWAAARDLRAERDHHLWDQIARALPKTKEVRKPMHLRSCPYEQIGTALSAIRKCGASACIRHAMEFTILTAARTGMVRLAVWEEIDLSKHRWTVPAARMKTGVEHRVPLSPAAMQILADRASGGRKEGLIFPAPGGKPHSDMTFTMQLRRLGLNFTMHGFRSTFRDWAAEQTAFPAEVCEAALAHALKNATEAAYFRSDLFDKRRDLMDCWAAYCESEAQAVSNLTTR